MTTEFQERVYALLRQVPRGRVTTYNDLARSLQSAPRAIGQACRRNPYSPDVPCHRVVRSDGGLGGFGGKTSGKNIVNKRAMLLKEGVRVQAGQVTDFERKRHVF